MYVDSIRDPLGGPLLISHLFLGEGFGVFIPRCPGSEYSPFRFGPEDSLVVDAMS
jgi:hypothetical protein